MATRKGDQAKQRIIEKIAQTFGEDFCGIVDKKLYVWANDGPGGERVQIAITLTMPKTPVTCGGSLNSNDAPWEVASSTTSAANPVELSEIDKKKVDELMKKLGLT